MSSLLKTLEDFEKALEIAQSKGVTHFKLEGLEVVMALKTDAREAFQSAYSRPPTTDDIEATIYAGLGGGV